MFKKLTLTLLTVCLLVALLAIPSFANESTELPTTTQEVTALAKVGDTEYADINDAIANWTNGTTLTLLSDVTLTDVIQLSSTEHHVLDLGTFTMTAASKKDAIQIVNNGRTSASYALDIKADATNPGGITASGKAVVKTTGKSGVKDRPIIRFYGGVFTGTNVVYHSGSNGTNCPQFWFYGGEFNGTVYANRALFQFYGGTFNGALQISVDSSAYALISGGRFNKLSNQYGSALNSDKFTIGSAKGVYNRGIYVDAEGYYVVTNDIITEVSAKYPAVYKTTYNSNNYFAYSAANTYGIFYESVEMAIANHGAENVTVWVKPAVTIPEDVSGDIYVVEEIKNNIALKDYTPENLPENAELEIELKSVEGQIVYDVTPMANGVKVEPAQAITFRLPIPKSVTENSVKVYHEGALMGTYAIKGENNAKYVELSSADFSEYALEPVESVAKIGDVCYATLEAAIEAAQTGDTVTILADLADVVVDVTENLTITGSVTLNNVGINANGAEELTVSGLTFTGNSWINAGSASKLTVSGVIADVTPSNASYTNSRSAFISLGRSEQHELELVVENCNVVARGGTDPILGWACVTKVSLVGNTFGSASAYQTNSDSVKFMAIADGAVLEFKNNTVYSNYNGIVLAQNTTRDNAYTATFDGNTFYGGADHIWIEITSGNTCHATVNVLSNNTVNGNAFTKGDIKARTGVIKNWSSYAGVDVVTDENGKVIGGSLAFNAADAIAEGYKVEADGSVVEDVTYVAEVNGVKYATLLGALAAAQSGDTVTLLGDLTLAAGDVDYYTNIKIPAGVTLDGGNYTLVVEQTQDSDYATIWSDGAYTVQNITIKVMGRREATRSIINFSKGGALLNVTLWSTVQDIAVNYDKPVDGMTLLVENCTIYSGAYAFYCDPNASEIDVTIKNNTITANRFGSMQHDEYIVGNTLTSGCTKGISLGASFTGTVTGNVFNGARALSVYGNQTISKNVISANSIVELNNGAVADLSGNYWGGAAPAENQIVADKATSVVSFTVENYYADEELTQLVSTKTYVAAIGETKYETLEAAIAAAQAGSTIVILVDELTFAENAASIVVDKALTINGNGAVLNFNSATSAFVIASGDVAFTNMTITQGSKSNSFAISISKGAWDAPAIQYSNVTISNVTFKGGNYALCLIGENVVVDGCTFEGQSSHNILVYSLKGDSEITDNVFKASTGSNKSAILWEGGADNATDLSGFIGGGTLTIDGNEAYDKGVFLQFTNWKLVKNLNLVITNNVVDGTTNKVITLYDMDGAIQAAGDEFATVKINNNVFTNTKSGRPVIREYTGNVEIDASENYFGSATPDLATLVVGAKVVVDSYYADEELTQLVSTKTYVAEVNGVQYTDLQEAINAANGSTVKLLANVTFTTVYADNKSHWNGDLNYELSVGGNVVLDLNGFTIETTGGSSHSYYALICVRSGSLTVVDTSEAKTGAIVCNAGTVAQRAYTIYNNGALILNGGTIHNGVGNYAIESVTVSNTSLTINAGATVSSTGIAIRVCSQGSAGTQTVVINGGTISGTYAMWIPLKNGGSDIIDMTINGGTFTGSSNAILFNTYTNGDVTTDNVKINGGVFNGNVLFGADYAADANNIALSAALAGTVISGGTFSNDVSEYCADGFTAEANGDGTFGIVEAKVYVAEVNGVQYTSLSEALAAVTSDNDTVVLLADITENLTGAYLRGNIVTKDGAKVTITLTNGDWVYCPYTFVIGENVTLNVPALFYYAGGAVIEGKVIAGAYYQMYAGTKLTIKAPGSLTVTSETFILRYTNDANAGIYIIGDNDDSTVELKLSVAYFYQGMINAKDANIVVGVYWPTNNTDGTGSANLVLDNSTLKVTVNEQKVITNGNCTITLKNGSTFDARVTEFNFSDSTILSVDSTSKLIDKNGELKVGLKGSGTEADPYQIGSVEDLILFRDSVNSGDDKYNAPGVYVVLTADLDLAGIDWSVNIGDDCNATFDGIFDGQNHVIKNLTSTETAQKGDGYICTGLFGAIYGNAVIKNLTIENATINVGNYTGSNVGVVVGFAYNATGSIQNVKVIGDVKVDAPKATAVGTIVGYLYNGNLAIEGCEVKANAGSYINAKSELGGIIGYGASAQITNSSVENLTLTADGLVGGVAGLLFGNAVVDGCSVTNVALNATSANWVNSAAVVLGSLAGNGATISNVTYSGVTANGAATTRLVGTGYVEHPDYVLPAVEAAVGNKYYVTFADAFAAANGETVTLVAKEIYLSDLADLKAFRDAVNAGYTFAGVTVYLTADIDLAGEEWAPIGSDKNHAFKGVFDGQENTISNLTINNANLDCAGLFGYTAGATIKNVNVHNVNIQAYSHVAAIVGHAYTGTIDNCHVSGNINLVAQYAYAAGITADGYVNVTNCSVIADTMGTIKVIEKTGAGGITGWRGEGNLVISNCTVKNLEISAWASVGGITGIAQYDNVIDGCTVENVKLTKTRVNGQASIGLVAGNWNNKADDNYTITITNNHFDNISINGTAITSLNQLCGSNYSYYDKVIKLVDEGNTYGTVTTNFKVVVNTLDELTKAIAYVKAGETIELGADITATEVILVGKSVTINGNGHTITSSASRVIRVTASNVEVTLNEVNMVNTKVRVGQNDIRGISIDASISNVKLTLNDCSVDFTDASACDWAYAVNVSGSGNGHTVTVNGGTYEGANVINANGANNTIVVKDATLTSLYLGSDSYFGACIYVVQNMGSSVEATGNTFNGVNAVAFNIGNGTALTESNNTNNTTLSVAKIGNTYYTSLEAAIAAAQSGDTITLLYNVTLGNTVTIDKNLTIDGNGKTITQVAGVATNNHAFLYIDGSDVLNVTIKNATFDGINGSAIRTVGANITIDNCVFQNCTHTGHQGVVRLNMGSAVIKNSKFLNNNGTMIVSFDYDAANDGDTLVIDNCLFEGNTAKETAIVYYADGVGCTITDSEFVNNTVISGGNAATIYLGFTENNVVTGNVFKNNTVSVSGTSVRVAGAIFFGYEAEVSGNVFVGNTATNANGDQLGQVCASTYYSCTIDLSGNYWGGNAPVYGQDYTVIHQTGAAEFELNSYYSDEALQNEVEITYAAKVGKFGYATLAEAFAAVKDGETITILAGTHTETVKLPTTLNNVTIKGAEGSVLKDMTISAADGNSYSYIGLTFDGLTFENSRIVLTGWRNGTETIKDLTITNCTFKNLNDTTNTAPVHINKDAAEAVENFTFTNNVIDGATGGQKSGVYAQVTGTVVFKNNVINNVSFRPYVIQITTDDGIADEFTVTGNTFSGSAAGRAQGLGSNGEGTDSVKLVVSGNVFKGITASQQICYWNFNPETTEADLSKNYYDINIFENPNKIYFNSAASNVDDLFEMGIFPIYTELNADGTINEESLLNPVALVDGNGYATLQAAINAADGKTVTLIADVALTSTVKLTAGKTVVLDLNGKTIDGTGKVRIAIMTYGNLTIKDSSADQSGIIKAGIGTAGNAINVCGGTFTLESGHIYSLNNALLIDEEEATINIKGGKITAEPTTRNSAAFYISSTSNTVVNITGGEIVGYNGILLWNNTTLNISGGSIDAKGSVAIQGNGSKDNTKITITDGTISGYYAAIYHPQGGELNISGGTLTGWTGVVVKGGKVTISGGTIKGNGAANTYAPASSGFVDTGDALYVEHYDNSTNSENYGTPVVVVTGGTFISVNGKAVASYKNPNNNVEALTAFISGGTFSSDVSDLCVVGYAAQKQSDGSYRVAEGLRGAGTQENPYLISTAADLFLFAKLVNNGTYKNVYVVLTNSIDLEQEDWTSIGTSSNPFTGTFDGQGHTIYNLWSYDRGLFGFTSTGNYGENYGNRATIKNLVLENVTVINNVDAVGGVVGQANQNTVITGVTVKGEILISGYRFVGGIVGKGYVQISDCHVDGGNMDDSSITATYWAVAGIVGHAGAEGGSSIKNCSAKNVTINSGSGGAAGIAGCGTAGPVENNHAENIYVNAPDWNNGIISGYVSNPTGSTASNVTFSNGDPKDAVVKVGNNYYFDLQAAINAAANNSTVVLLKNVNKAVTISGKTLTLDLNGKKVSSEDSDAISVTNGANVTISNGTLVSNGNNCGGVYVRNAKLTLEDCTLTGTNTAQSCAVYASNGAIVTINDCELTGNHYAVIMMSANVTVNGGTFNAPVSVSANGSDDYDDADLTINGGTFNGAIYWPANGKLTVNDGTFTANTAIYLKSGSLEINGGTFTGNGEYNDYVFTLSGFTATGSAIVIENVGSSEYDAIGTVTITGGKFTSVNNKAIESVTAGNVEAVTGFISGGTFSSDVTDLCVEGLVAKQNADGSYGIVEGLRGTGTQADPYVIGSLTDLKWFRDDVNAGNTYAGKYVVLAVDIDLAGEEWTPIGTSSVPFKGTFDGKNHTISNLVINGGSKSNIGFFGYTMDGEIRNLTFNNAKVSGRLNVAVVAGTPYTSKFTNINVTGHVEVDGLAYVGGVGGKNAYADWTDITVDVDATSYVKGNSVENGTAYRTYVGGVIGFNGEGNHTFKNIYSNIKVIGSTADIGGIFGIAHYGNKFENITFAGSVEAPADAEEVGGIAGVWNNTVGYTVTFTNCTSTGTVTVGDNTVTGSIVGGAYNADNYLASNSGSLIINGKESWIKVVKVGENYYTTLEEAAAAAQAGDVIVLLDNVTLSAELTLPANVTLDGGEGFQINGTINAGGNLTFKGHVKVTGFSASYYNRVITIGEGACLEITGTGRVTLGYGNTFNITGSITNAKTADKANIKPSLIIPGGMSITGGNDATMNVTNAYVVIGSTSSKNSAANGTFTLNFNNSIAEFTNQLTISEPTGGKTPTFNINVKDSVLTTATKFIVAAPNSTVVIDNSLVTLGTYFRNSGNFTVQNGSVFTGATIQFGENGGNNGTLIVDASELTIKAGNAGHALDGKGTGKITVQNGGYANVDYVTGLAVELGANSKFATKVENLDVDVIVDGYSVQYVDGAYSLVQMPVKLGNTYYATLAEALENAQAGDTIEILADITESLAAIENVTIITNVAGGVVINNTFTDDYVDFTNVTIGSGVTVNMYNVYSNGNGTVNVIEGTLNASGVYYNSSNAKTYIQNGGKLSTVGMIVNRYHTDAEAGIYVYNGNVSSANTIGTYSGTFYAENAVVEGNMLWIDYFKNGSGESDTYTVSNVVFKNSVLNVASELRLYKDASLTFVDTTVTAGKVQVRENATPTTSVTNSTIKANSVENLAGATVNAVLDANGYVTFVKFVAMVGTKGYATLQAAINAAQTGDTVTLLCDVALNNTITINKSITIEGNGYTITPANAETTYNSAFMVGDSGWNDNHGETITIKNVKFTGWKTNYGVVRAQGVTLAMNGCEFSGNNVSNYAYAVLSLNYTTATIENTKFVDNTSRVIDINYNGDSSNAVVTIDGCYFEGNYSTDAGIVMRSKGQLILKNSAFINNTVNTNGNAATVYVGFGTGSEVTGCYFEGNSVTTSHAGTKRFASAIFCDGTVVNGNAFVNNTATRNGQSISTIVAVGAYYGDADLSGNYWNDGNKPVLGEDFTIEYSKKVTVASYYASYTYENGVLTLGTLRQPAGKIAYRAYVNDSANREAIGIDLEGLYADESVVVKLYDKNGNLLTTTTLKAGGANAANFTVNVVLWGSASGSWDTVIHVDKLTVTNLPETIELYVDGKLVDTFTNALGAGTNVDQTGKYIALDCVEKAAKIGNTYYATLEEAFKAVQAGETITLMSDVTVTELWDCRTNGAKFASSVTIDGNGHTLTFNCEVKDNNWNTIFRFEDVTTVKNLTIDVTGASGAQRVISAKLGITLDNVTILANSNVRYGVIFGEGAGAAISDVEVSITNSEFVGMAKAISDNANAQDAKNVTITDNAFTNTNVYVSAYEKVTFTGNTVAGGIVDIRSYTAIETLAVTATGNTLDTAAGENIALVLGTNVDVQDEFNTPVAKVNGKYFVSLADAIAKANGGTVVLLKDLELTETVTVTGTVTLDLNGKTISRTINEQLTKSFALITNKGTLTITGNGKISVDYTGNSFGYGVGLYTISNEGGTLNIESGRIENLTTVSGSMYDAIDNNSTLGNAVLNISGGEIYCGYLGIRQFANSTTYENTVNVTGGTITGGNSAIWTQNPGNNNVKANVLVSGGYIDGRILLGNSAEFAVAVSGGTFTVAVPENYCAEGYIPTVNADGTYGVKVGKYVAEVNGTKYETVLEALQAAIDSGASEVVILKDVREKMTVDFDLVINADLTITADKAVKVEFYNEGTAYDFAVGSTNGNTLTIGENVHFDLTDRVIWLGYYGNNVDVVVDGYLGGYQIWHGADTTVNGTLDSHGEAFIMRRDATLTVNGGTVNANYFHIYSGHIEATDATITAGLVWIYNNHSYGSEGTVSFKLDNTDFTSNGVVTVYAGEGKQVDITLTNGSTLTAAGAYTAGANVFAKADADSDFIAQGKSIFTVQAGDYKYTSLAQAFANAQNGDTVTLLANVALSESIKVTGTVTLDLNGKTIAGTDNNTSGNFYLFDNRGNLTITGNGTITLTATNDRGTSSSSVVVANNPGGTLVVENGTIEHLGGTYMAYALDNLTNGKGTSAVMTINGGTIKSTYRAIRQFLNGVEAQNVLTINGGIVEGENKAIFFHDPSKNANSGKLTVGANAVINGDIYLFVTAESTEWPVEVSIAASAVNGDVTSKNVPYGYEVNEVDGFYTVEKVTYVAKIGDTFYKTLEDALAAAQNGDTVTLLAPIVIAAGETLTIDVSGVIIEYNADVAGEAMITNYGTLNIVNGTIRYTYTGAADSSYSKGNSTIDNRGTLTIDGGNVINATAAMSHAFYAINNNAGATLEINGGNVTNANGHAIRMVSFGAGANNVTINGGKITGTRAIQVQLPGSDASVAPEMNLVIAGGELVANEQTYNLAVYVYSNGNSAANVKVTVSGGVINGNIAINEAATKTMADGAALISGGTINGEWGIYSYAADDVAASKIAFTGGIFKTNYSEIYAQDDLVAFTLKNGVYHITLVYAEVGGVYYGSIEEALAAANGQTVTVLRDYVNTSAYLVVVNGATLDLNGCTVTVAGLVAFKGSYVVDNGATKGLLEVPNGNLVIYNNTFNDTTATVTALPVWNEAGTGYIFVAVKSNFNFSAAEDKITVNFKPSISGAGVTTSAVFGNGAADNGISYKVIVHCYNASGEVEAIEFAVSDELLASVHSNNTSVKFVLSGATDSFSEYVIELQIVSDAGVTFSSVLGSYTPTSSDSAAE